jgi:hypothetical protein
MIDPLIPRIVAVGFGLLWIGAAWHKFEARESFQSVLADYRLLPTRSPGVVSRLLPMIEAALSAAWLFALWPVATVSATAMVLAAYATAIAINLSRGRTHIACGCSFSVGNGEQPLSWTLVLRNLLLIVLAVATLLPQTQRLLSVPDYIVLVLALLVAMLLHTAVTQLLHNRGVLRAWSKAHE